MGKSKPFHAGIARWLTGWLALCLLLLINFKSVAITSALWLVELNGHDHRVIVQADGDHFDIRLTHSSAADHPTAEDHHDSSSFGLMANLFSTHDHDGSDHVLHFTLNEAPDQIRQRNNLSAAPAPSTPVSSAAIISFCLPRISIKPRAAVFPHSATPLSANLLGLRTTVLLI